MPTEFELRIAEKAAREAAPGMGGFSARAVALAVLTTLERNALLRPLPAAGDLCLGADGKPCRILSLTATTEAAA